MTPPKPSEIPTTIFDLPENHKATQKVAAVSGGKDSTALILALREREIECKYVFADTGWEAPETYEYVDNLKKWLGITIDTVQSAMGGMADIAKDQARFPARIQRWCTRELKVLPIIEYHRQFDCDTISVVGIRRDESTARTNAKGFEFEKESDWYTWRPLIDWTIPDVLAIHHKHGIPINPLYRKGFGRVGCMPCIMSNKQDIRLMAKHYPERVQLIRDLEGFVSAERLRRNVIEPGRYKHTTASFFLNPKRDNGVAPIDKVVAWSNTKHGGKAPLVDDTPDNGCYRWGLCDALPPPPSKLKR